MKLITEVNEGIEIITEATANGEKKYTIEGTFLQGDITNRNKRKYPFEMLKNKVNDYIKEFVNQYNTMFGGLVVPSSNLIIPGA